MPPLFVNSISNKMCLSLTEINESVHIVFKIFISYLRTKVYAMYCYKLIIIFIDVIQGYLTRVYIGWIHDLLCNIQYKNV